ncbi:MAG: TonB-dependent receptor [Proteobacteria bacterium]|nr:TonB-dependent receptor [Pseudomonadota bacterium]
MQGIGGTGGIVNQVTVGAPKTDGVSGRVLLQGTADNDFRSDGIGGKAAGLVQWKSGRFDASFGAAYEKRGVFYDGDGRRVGLNLTQGETQDSATVSLFSRIGYQLGDTGRIDLIASRFELKGGGNYVAVPGNRATGLPTSAIRGDAPGKPAASRTESVALTYTDTALGGGNFIGQIFFNRTHDTFGGEIAPIATFQDPRLDPTEKLFDQSENRSRKLGAKLSYERAVPGFEALTATLGFDALVDKTEQRLIATARIWVPPSDFRSLAPFAQANLKLFGGKLRLAGGARYENVEIRIDDYHTLASTTYVAPNKATYGGVAVSGGKPKFEDLLFNGGVIVEPVPGIRAYASYAEGFTVPDIGRITRAIKVPGVDLDNYLDISPIVSNNREIGVEAKRGPLDASVTYFWSSSDKGQLLIARASGIFDVQRQRVEIEGLEVNLGVKLPMPGLKASIGYAHLKGRYDADAVPDGKVDTDLDGTNISPDRINLAADYASGPFSARVQTQFYLSRRFDGKARTIDDANPLHPQKLFMNDFGGYVLTDAHVRYQTGLGGLSLSVTNLFDKMYIDYSSDTRLPNDNTVFYAGRGRTFTLGWDYRF